MKLLGTICADGHERILFTGKQCPLCFALDAALELQALVDRYEGVVRSLQENAPEAQVAVHK